MKIKTYKVFESTKSLNDYNLTSSLYKFDMQRYYDRLPNDNIWSMFKSMENYLQEYVDDDRIHCFISPFNNSIDGYDIRLSWNIIHKELNTVENIKDKLDILEKFYNIIPLLNIEKFCVKDGAISAREFVVLNIDLKWEK